MEGFRHHVPITIRWGDLDSLGHVNNANYLTYMEHARVAYFAALELWHGTQSAVGLILAKVNIDFRLPLHVGDSIGVYSRVVRLGNKSLDREEVIVRDADGAVAATASVVLVAYDYSTQQTIPIPDTWRLAIQAYEPQSVS